MTVVSAPEKLPGQDVYAVQVRAEHDGRARELLLITDGQSLRAHGHWDHRTDPLLWERLADLAAYEAVALVAFDEVDSMPVHHFVSRIDTPAHK